MEKCKHRCDLALTYVKIKVLILSEYYIASVSISHEDTSGFLLRGTEPGRMYDVGDVPLAFAQEDFLIFNIVNFSFSSIISEPTTLRKIEFFQKNIFCGQHIS